MLPSKWFICMAPFMFLDAVVWKHVNGILHQSSHNSNGWRTEDIGRPKKDFLS
jgi:hypothetical protein